jgi:hypothetical protein
VYHSTGYFTGNWHTLPDRHVAPKDGRKINNASGERIFQLKKCWKIKRRSFSSYLLHVIVELDLLLPEPGDELLGCDGPHLPFLGHDAEQNTGGKRSFIPQQKKYLESKENNALICYENVNFLFKLNAFSCGI